MIGAILRGLKGCCYARCSGLPLKNSAGAKICQQDLPAVCHQQIA